ncbi:chromate efflux transporter [Orrella daihaiensis]|uniref:Chromate efflux transporter n=1 Tax=Orrella daihaiensis TaxID=2782176 RepID=A0ABY4AJW3_9BURK|nr:chromate efflux transporter [Orrella daihaiensis]UOD50577.1 chromate efflux transporter [Orrella daihaiensis]
MPYLDILRAFLRLGLTSFGGPVAHIGYFRDEFVTRRQWVSDAQFTSWLAICQALPGPASSQLGFLIGLHRGGWVGAVLAWAGFTLPSAIALVLVAIYGLQLSGQWVDPVIDGLKLVAVVVVAQAVLGMFKSLCRHTLTRVLSVVGFAVALGLGGWSGQIGAILIGAMIGFLMIKHQVPGTGQAIRLNHVPSVRLGTALLIVMASVLLILPGLAATESGLQMFDAFYRAGALVFGGGHVVLPLLESATVSPGLVSSDAFLTGYSLAQAVPGPLFTFAAWLGALDTTMPGWGGALLALVAIFLPGLLLVTGVLPWWHTIVSKPWAFGLLAGVNATVVGVLAAAWVDPIVTTSVTSISSGLVATVGAALLLWRKYHVLVVVVSLPLLMVLFDWIGL